MSKVLVIVPAFNEAQSVGKTVDQIRDAFASADIVVIDDGSVDSTAYQAKAHGAKVLPLPFNLGIGGAVQTGFKYAFENGYEIAVQIDGDGQHDAFYLPQVIGPILNNSAHMVIGSRFISPDSEGFKSTIARRIGISFFVKLISVLTGARVTDPTSGFRAHGKILIEQFAKDYPHDFPEPEAVVVARRLGANVVEVPVVMRARQGGESSIGKLKSVYYMIKVTVAILLQMIRPIERKVA